METQVIAIIAATTLSAIAISYIKYANRKKSLQNSLKNADWKFIGVVEKLSVFPVTSAAPMLLNEVQCKIDGFYSNGVKDRFLILYDERGNYVFSETYPKMLSITTEVLDRNTLLLKAPLTEPLKINLELLKNKNHTIKQKQGFKLYLVEGELEYHNWFSKVILNKSEGLKLFLCLKTEFENNFKGADKNDLIPIMVMKTVSVNDHLQFRGNLLIKSHNNVNPYEKDNWSWLRFGEKKADRGNCVLHYEAPYLRCKRIFNFEPLKTLNKYYSLQNSTQGAYYKIFQEGIIKQNDPVYATIT